MAETNRVPFDLPESESELVAGFVTEYSSIYYSLIVLTEYTNNIILVLFMIIIYSLPSEILLLCLYITSLIRSTIVRLKFDELMINVWMILIPIVFVLFLLILVLYVVFYSFNYTFWFLSSPTLCSSLSLTEGESIAILVWFAFRLGLIEGTLLSFMY